ncbi:hypothetical protein F5Y17DRAFT_374886 [Xylariaceae sp. FL0594]|nr:hypothetical protein F5Y17DRAFT_374886 [Xylariaceae sp. FL0594]
MSLLAQDPPSKHIHPVPVVGAKAPTHPNLKLPSDKPTIIVFLRHCGCPFAEKTFRELTKLSTYHKDVHFVAVSHCSPEITERWVVSVGGNWDVEVLIDEQRDLYALFGLGTSTTWHVYSPAALYSALQLGKRENIWNRPAAENGGSRWQMGGAFAISGGRDSSDGGDGNGNADGVVRWAFVPPRSDILPDWDAAVQSVGVTPRPKPPPPVRTDGFL